MSQFQNVQICENGHLMNSDSGLNVIEKYCKKCGALGINKCPECNAEIHGHEIIPGVIWTFSIDIPQYCYNCGKPYPWTRSAIESTAQIVQEEELYDEQQKKQIIESLENIITDGPKTSLATMRMKKALQIGGKFTVDALRQFIIDFGSEVVKKAVGL